ncbi:hypothetical protein [Streptomyces bungoensis]|uniref:hypothetical protein n=1 Tax=Streptomyces bungoensis TaxID=285568 RepID=UPI00343ABC76
MVLESTRAVAPARALLDRAAGLRADADLMDGYARRLHATATALAGRAAAPAPIGPALRRQAVACRTAAGRLRTAAEALAAHARAGA